MIGEQQKSGSVYAVARTRKRASALTADFLFERYGEQQNKMGPSDRKA